MTPPLLRGALAAILLVSFVPRAEALVLWGAGNDANITDPGTGVPWDAVGRVAGSDLSAGSTSGSAVHIGDGFMLTANHVSIDPTRFVTFNGVDSFAVDTTFHGGNGVQIASGVDLKLFRLASVPLTSSVALDSTGGSVSPATVVTYGVGRGATSPSSSPVAWGAIDTVAKRWGINVPRALSGISYDTYSYAALWSVAGNPSDSPGGVGGNEAALTAFDSGSGMFQNISGVWYLIGVATLVEQQSGANTSTFGVDAVTGSGRGDRNFHASVATYRSQILAAVPEPSALSLAAFAAAAALLGIQKRTRQAK